MKFFKKFGKKAAVVFSACAAVPALAVNSFAAVDLVGFTVDTATPETLAATILTALGVIWGIRKLVKLVNRS